MFVTTIDLNSSGQESKNAICSLDFWHTCDREKGQGYQTWHELVGPKQDHEDAKFERLR